MAKLLDARRWQVAFLLGLFATIATAILAFGFSTLSVVVSLTILVIGILNALLSRSSSGEARENWFTGWIRARLNIGPHLKIATITVWSVTLGLSSYTLYNAYREWRKVTIAGYVETAAGEPADNAFVTLSVGHQKRETLTIGGTFEFKDIAVPLGVEECSVTARSKKLLTSVTFDLDKVTAPLHLKLPPGNPPFRIIYFDIGGPAIDLVTQGRFPKELEQALGGNLFLVQNDVMSFVKQLAASFQEEYIGDLEKAPNDPADQPIHQLGPEHGKVFFGGTRPMYDVEGDEDIFQRFGIENLNLTNWDLDRTTWNPDDPYDFLLWRFADDAEIQQLSLHDSAWYRFYSKYIKGKVPDCCIIHTDLVSCGGDMVFAFVAKQLRVRVVIIENQTANPIQIGAFSVAENSNQATRRRATDQQLLNDAQRKERNYFPIQYLGPKEKLLVMLEAFLAFDRSELPFSGAKERGQRIMAIENGGGEVLTINVVGSTFKIRRANLLKSLSKDPLADSRMLTEYILGPSMRLLSVNVNGTAFPIRAFNPRSLVIAENFYMGSCPTVYTYSVDYQQWKDEGHFLYGMIGKRRESIEEKPLSGFSGRLLLKENDPETSFIDYVYVKVLLQDGREIILLPLRDQLLRLPDEKYLRLRHGESAEIQFEFLPSDSMPIRYTLVSKGYYLPSSVAPLVSGNMD